MPKKQTLLEFLLLKNLSKKEIKILSMTDKILVNFVVETNLQRKISIEDKINIKEKKKKWVSRGALKLLKAIEIFDLDFNDKVVLDIGSSTGGFTQVALSEKAKKVYSLDVGSNQLDYFLRINPKVVVKEKTNLKEIKKTMFEEKYIDITITDVSFISLYHVFKVIKDINCNTIMALIKPQFEAYKKDIKNGYVEEKDHKSIIEIVKNKALEFGFEIIKVVKSPILGYKKKNIEYISLIKRKEKNE